VQAAKQKIVNIALVDDHQLFIDSLSLALPSIDNNYHITSFTNPQECLNPVFSLDHFDLLICDLLMKEMNGLLFIQAVRKRSNIPILMLSGITDTSPADDVEKLGGNGFLHKSTDIAYLDSVIQKLLAGRNYFPECELKNNGKAYLFDDQIDEESALPNISVRQLQVLRLLSRGATNQQIAAELNISLNTVKTHLRQIFTELQVTKRTSCVRAAQIHGLV